MAKKKNKTKKKQNIKSKSSSNTWIKSLDIPLVVVTIILILIGLLTLFSASSTIGLSTTGDTYFYVKRQVEALGIGLLLLIVAMLVDYRRFNNKLFLTIIMFLIIFLIVIVRVSGLDEGGARRWIYIGNVNFQPSEFIKLGMIFVMAGLLQNLIKNKQIKKVFKGFLFPLGIAIFVALLIFIFQNHLSAAIVIGAVTLVQMFIAGVNFIALFMSFGLGVVGIVGMLITLSSDSSNFRAERILAWKNPENYSQGKGYQILQSLYAIGSGGLTGVGIGASRQKQEFLPYPQNDFIASIFAEEFGFIGIIVLLILFGLLLYRAIKISHNAKDIFGKLLGIGITTLFAFEIILNLFVITNLVPVTGIGLPFFSYGGTAMIVNLIAIGILLNIHRVSKRKE